MNNHPSKLIACTVLSFLCVCLSSIADAAYVFTDLGTLGGTWSHAQAINNSGQVVGWATTAGDGNYQATIWNGNIATRLESLGTGAAGYAYSINDIGFVAGLSESPNNQGKHTTVWNNSTPIDLGPVGGFQSYGFAINNSGQVVGQSSPIMGMPYHATLWNDKSITDLGTLGGVSSIARSINNSGTVVGYSFTDAFPATVHATMWKGIIPLDLGTLGGSWSWAYGINDSGVVAGSSYITNDTSAHATLWNSATLIDLGTLGGAWSEAYAINNSGQAVGYSQPLGKSSMHATLWNGNNPTDLNNYLDKVSINAGWELQTAYSINDNGWIVGDAFNNISGQTHGFLLTKYVPIASAGSDQNIYLGQPANLDASSSSSPEGLPLTYIWKLEGAPVGSKAVLTAENTAAPNLTPDMVGAYHLSLVVNDGTFDSVTSTLLVNVSLNLPPVASAKGNTVNPVNGSVPLQVVFDASASHDPENSALAYNWSFGDPASGVNNTSSQSVALHTYTVVGNYTAVVTVTDNMGKTDQASVTVNVTAPNLPPVLTPTATPNNGAAPLSVQFIANATDVNSSDVLSYNWNFGDGTPVSTLPNPQHTYEAGTYMATLTVLDGVNAPVTVSLVISVSSALTIDVTEAVVERGDKGKVEGKISMQADFNFAGMPKSTDIIQVKFDGIALFAIPFGKFHQESAGKFEYESSTQESEINFNQRTIRVSTHKILTDKVDNTNGVDVVVSFGTATGTDNFVMTNPKVGKNCRDCDLAHKKDGRDSKK